MNPFPKEHDLLALFGCEPVLRDDDMGWQYNHLKFVSRREGERLECEMEPADGALNLRWSVDGAVRLHLELAHVSGLLVRLGKERDEMEVVFGAEQSFVRPLTVQVKPHVSVHWGTSWC